MPIMLDGETRTIQVSGSVGFSPVILNMPQDYQILNRLLMPSFSEYIPWMAYRLLYQTNIPNLYYDPNVNLKEMNLPILKETVFYDIKGNEKYILVEFKDSNKIEALF